MFYEFENETWTASAGTVVISANTDYSIDGSSRKLVWTAGADEYVTIAFDAIDLSDYEELSFQIDQRALSTQGNLFKITVDGVDYNFTSTSLVKGWNHILLDCTEMGSISTIVITSLVVNLTLFIDVLGYREVGHDRDVDLLEAIQDTISLSYGVATTLSANVAAGSSSIALTSYAHIFNTTALTLDNGSGTTETVYLEDDSGTIKGALTNAFSSGDAVTAICPVLLDDYMDVEPDPVCGITIFDKETKNDVYYEYFLNGLAKKVYTGALGVLIYIDCSSELKLLTLAREFDTLYGESFRVLLDGGVFTVWLDDTEYVENMIGNNPRMAYYYRIESQGFTVFRSVDTTTTLTITLGNVTDVIG
jgi:hypothetical protein